VVDRAPRGVDAFTPMVDVDSSGRTAPDALGYFVGDYTGLDHFGTTFHPAWVTANDGNLANRTDVFHRTAG
jgi:hypothetical protein